MLRFILNFAFFSLREKSILFLHAQVLLPTLIFLEFSSSMFQSAKWSINVTTGIHSCSESSCCYWQQKKSSRIIRHWVCPTSVSHGNGIWTMNYVLTQLPMSTWLIYHKLMRETIPICQQSYLMLSHIQISHLLASLNIFSVTRQC